MAAIQLEIVTPARKVLSESCDEVYVPGSEGTFGVLPMHAGLVGTLSSGPLTYKTAGATKTVAIRGGFVQVLNDKVIVLADEAKTPDQIDKTKLAAERAELEKNLLSADVSTEEREKLFAQRGWLDAQAVSAL